MSSLTPVDAVTPAPTAAPDTEQPAEDQDGPLLTEKDEPKVCKLVEYMFAADEKRMVRRAASWRRNRMWRQGLRNVYLVADENNENVNVYAPATTSILPPVPNPTDRNCRRVTAQLLVDPPQPEVLTANADPDEVAAAEFSTKLLTTESNESGVNFRRKAEQASDMAHTYASSFSYGTLDPKGGGWEPMDIWAHPNAIDANAALSDPIPFGFPGHIGETSQTVRKFVLPNGQLSPKPKGARKRWLPKIKWQILTGYAVRFIPHTVTSGLEDANGVVCVIPTTLGELKSQFPALAEWKDDELSSLAQYRPPKLRDVLSGREGGTQTRDIKTTESGKIEDSTQCYPLVVYMKSHGRYPRGAYVVIAAGKVIHRQPWAFPNEQGDEECLELPLSQCKDVDSPDMADPYGSALAGYLGPLDEINAQLWVYSLEWMYRHGNPNVFIPVTSPVQPEQLRRRDGTPIDITSKDDAPIYEVVPDMPRTLGELSERIANELDSESGLQEAARGVSSPEVQSGKHAQEIIEQALVALGSMKRNLDDFIVRMWRVHLQLIRAFYTTPQQLRYEGDDGAWKVREWSRTDLKSVKDVRIARGSGTMLSPTAKRQGVLEDMQMGLIALEEGQELLASGISNTSGYKGNTHRQRVRRQLAKWREGPPEAPPPPSPEQVALGAPQVDPLQIEGQAAMEIWAPIAADEEPNTAKIRFFELSRTMATSAYERWAPDRPWRQAFDGVYQAARFGAGVMTMAEQQMAAQQAQQQQQQAEMDKQAAKGGAAPPQQSPAPEPQAEDADQAQAAAAEMRNAEMVPA